jgi:hypothetical protein
MQFPPGIALTNQRPDIVIWSLYFQAGYYGGASRAVGAERTEEAYKRKREKYQNLVVGY